MTYCTHCGKWHADGLAYCSDCGNPLIAAGDAAQNFGYMPLGGNAGFYVIGPDGLLSADGRPSPAATPVNAAPSKGATYAERPHNGVPEHGGPAMLKLSGIKKNYKIASGEVPALKGVSLEFRKSEFVCILGQSGCGKTTLLNIIGGLDHYTEGDLVIQGRSTKKYRDRDWDVYRNHRIGFIFQTYNLIPHQTVLENVELALTIAGVGKAERRERASRALERVGLGKELKKRPNQLSGGQMQRVAIARAIVNDPDILLADEPTGALDSATSVEVMDLIKEIARERLVIMVTHNGELAEQYASRIVRLKDGLVESDSNPYIGDRKPREKAVKKEEEKGKQRAKMGFFTSLALSFRNLLTKKGRTVITSVAGSIGIISVCLVLALSNGFNNYIRHTEEDMLSYYPLEISETALDVTSVMSAITKPQQLPSTDQIADKVYINSFLTGLAQGVAVQNNISPEYIDFIEKGKSEHSDWFSAVQYAYGFDLPDALFTSMTVGGGSTGDKVSVRYNSVTDLKAFLIQELINEAPQYTSLLRFVDFFTDVINKMPGTTDFGAKDYGKYVRSQYDLIAGHFPENANEAVLVVGENNAVLDLTLVQLGFLTEERFLELFNAGLGQMEGDIPAVPMALVSDPVAAEEDVTLLPFDRVFAQDYVLYYTDTLYPKTGEDAGDLTKYPYVYRGTRENLEVTEEQGIPFKISGILRLKENYTYGCLSEGLNLTEATVDQYVRYNAEHSEMIKWMSGDEAKLDFSVGGMQAYRSPAEHLNENYTALSLSSYKDSLFGLAFLSVLQAQSFLLGEFPEAVEGSYIKAEVVDYFTQKQTVLANGMTKMLGIDQADAEALAAGLTEACSALKADDDGKIVRSDLLKAIGGELAKNETVAGQMERGMAEEGLSLQAVVYLTMMPDNIVHLLGGNDAPDDILIYASDFDAKERILKYLDTWNETEGRAEEDKITYTDRVGLLMGMVQTMLDVITYVLVAFTAISLVVSSVMIGIITYVSVVERVKEIGVLRSLGARKQDIRNLFNAETFIIGLAAGLIGIGVTYGIAAIVSAIIFSLSGIAGIASLPPLTAFIMVCVSVLLTLISGLIPAQAAARKDPVIALRTE